MTFRGLPVARVAVAVGEPGWVDGRPAIVIRSRGQSDGMVALFGELRWELTTTLDTAGGRPITSREESAARLGGKVESYADEGAWSDGDRHHDVHSAVGVVRGWRSRAGDRAAFEVRIIGFWLDVAIADVRREYHAAARVPAVRYEGVIRDKYRFVAWISDDADRVPLGLRTASKWGEIALELAAYHAPPR